MEYLPFVKNQKRRFIACLGPLIKLEALALALVRGKSNYRENFKHERMKIIYFMEEEKMTMLVQHPLV